MTTNAFEVLTRWLSSYKLDDALLFLSFVLQASHDPVLSSAIYEFARKHPDAISDFKIEFLAKWLIIKSSLLSPYELNWPAYLESSELYNRIQDPIVSDPTFHGRNPIDVFIRLLAQQVHGQNRIPLQSLGSANMLFQETGAWLADTIGYNIPERFRDVVGLSIDQFMQIGVLVSGARSGPLRTNGTVSLDWLKKGQAEGLGILSDENVIRFLAATACSIDEFRQLAADDRYRVSDPAYILYEFNPLKKRPLVQVAAGRWVAPSPGLIIDRVTQGIYYDLLDADHVTFTRAFGSVLEEYVGTLLKSVYSPTQLVRELTYVEHGQSKKGPADWVIVEAPFMVLVECKSFIPNLDFVSVASRSDIESYALRLANAIEQSYRHLEAIMAGVPALQQLSGLIPKVMVLTMGQMHAANTVFFRKEINAILSSKGIRSLSYAILSLQELEWYLSLVERRVPLSDLLVALESENLQEALKPYQDMLSQSALLSIIRERGEKTLDSL